MDLYLNNYPKRCIALNWSPITTKMYKDMKNICNLYHSHHSPINMLLYCSKICIPNIWSSTLDLQFSCRWHIEPVPNNKYLWFTFDCSKNYVAIHHIVTRHYYSSTTMMAWTWTETKTLMTMEDCVLKWLATVQGNNKSVWPSLDFELVECVMTVWLH